MTVLLNTSYPLDGATQVSSTIATSNLSAIAFTLQSDSPPINVASLVVRVNNELVIASGAPVISRFFSTISTPSSSSISVTLVFTNPLDSFESFESVNIDIGATDSNSTYSYIFSFRVEDTQAPLVTNFSPLPNSNDSLPTTPIFFKVEDQGSGALLNSLNVAIYENQVTAYTAILGGVFQPGFSGTITQNSSSTDVLILRDGEYPSDAYISAAINVQDETTPINVLYTFQIIDILPPQFANLIPQPNSIDNDPNTTITFTLVGEHVFGLDAYGSGIDQTSLNVSVNDVQAITSGSFVYPVADISSMFLPTYFPSSSIIQNLTVVLKLSDLLPSAQTTKVKIEVKDGRANKAQKTYSFFVKDYLAPTIINAAPSSSDQDVLPNTDIRFTISEEKDGYGLNFATLNVTVDGYSVLNQLRYGIPVDGYIDGYLTRTFSEDGVDIDGYYETFSIEGYDGYNSFVAYPGFKTTIRKVQPYEYDFIIDPLTDFIFNQSVAISIDVQDRGSNFQNTTYSFQVADAYSIITTAHPSTGTYKNYIDGYGKIEAYKFLYETGVTLTTNLSNTITFYTTDGTMPRINKYNQVIGTTQVYTKPILINRVGLNNIKYFSIDSAGNRETLKQENYMIDPIPPELEVVQFARIVADIPYATTIVPVEYVELFSQNELVRILDDTRPPVITTILTINNTSIPPFIIVQDKVAKLKVSRNARVEKVSQPIQLNKAIDFDTTKMAEFLYIGSDGDGANQADSVIEELRVLNFASTDDDILADFTLLSKGVRFFNQDSRVTLSSEFSTLESTRANLPDNTLVLAHFDGNYINTPRQGVLTNNTNQIVDVEASSNDIIFTITIKKNEDVDRELLRKVLQDFAPIDLNIIVNYIEVE